MGKRYSREEIDQIQALISEGYTDREIATRLGRTENGVRNIRHRKKIKEDTSKSIQSLLQDKRMLSTKISQLRMEIESLKARRDSIREVLRTEEETLNKRLQLALWKLKDQKPELFHISVQEQIGKIAGTLTVDFLKWLFR